LAIGYKEKVSSKSNNIIEKLGTCDSSLISSHLMEVYKVNNFYHFNIDFREAVRINKMKIIFDEKSKKQNSFKMRISVSVPDYQDLTQDEIK
jgi:hypothetical protein